MVFREFIKKKTGGWTFSNVRGFLVPLFDDNDKIQSVSIHLDNPYNGTTDLWFSSSGKINGTSTKSWVVKNNICEDTETVILTDNIILSNLIKDVLNEPVITFSNISSSYQILNVIDNTNIKNIIFTIRPNNENQNLDYIIHRIFKDLIPLGYNIDSKFVENYKYLLKEDFLCSYRLQKVA